MTDNFKTFLQKTQNDKDIKKEIDALKDENDRNVVIKKAIEIAKKAGITLTESDFEEKEGEMEDAEMAAVAGGYKKCSCFAGGGGKADEDGKTCACVGVGYGYNKMDDMLRCHCVALGSGYDSIIK